MGQEAAVVVDVLGAARTVVEGVEGVEGLTVEEGRVRGENVVAAEGEEGTTGA